MSPLWKTVVCPICGSQAGVSCGRTQRGANYWIRTAPHTERKRIAEALRKSRPSLTDKPVAP